MLEEQKAAFFHAVLALRDIDEAARFFDDMLTLREVEKLAHRWQIFLLLHQGLTHRKIAERLGVGIFTVSRGNRAYRRPGSIVRSIIERLRSSE